MDTVQGWDWVALGTTILAIATVYLGVQTRRAVRVSRDEVAAAVRPLLVDLPFGVYMRGSSPRRRDEANVRQVVDGDVAHLDFALRNVGAGLALLAGEPTIATTLGPIEGRATQTAIAVGEYARIWFQLPLADYVVEDQPVSETTSELIADVTYTDFAGKQLTTTRVEVRRDETEGWRIDAVKLISGSADTPFAALDRAEYAPIF